ncbi:MAG: hypothetical protein ITF98_07980 [Fermentimonas sp.]|nr:hypothetical protein [Fermentimonas sp.]
MMKNKTYLSVQIGAPIGITLLMLFFALSLTADNSIITISGYVTCQGERISDVAVEAETTNDVTISDREGKFSVTVKKGGVVLFKKNGYTPYEHIASNPHENLIVCLFPEDDSNNSEKHLEKTTEEEKESIINIQTKKETPR